MREITLIDMVASEIIKFDYIDEVVEYVEGEFGNNYRLIVIVEKSK